MTVVLNLPFPPSTNRIWRKNARSTKGVYRSPQYIAWLKAAWAETLLQKPEKVKGPYRLTVRVGRPDKRKRDIGNFEKPVSDFLVGQGIVEDDSLATQITMQWADDVKGCQAIIEPEISTARLSTKVRVA